MKRKNLPTILLIGIAVGLTALCFHLWKSQQWQTQRMDDELERNLTLYTQTLDSFLSGERSREEYCAVSITALSKAVTLEEVSSESHGDLRWLLYDCLYLTDCLKNDTNSNEQMDLLRQIHPYLLRWFGQYNLTFQEEMKLFSDKDSPPTAETDWDDLMAQLDRLQHPE